MLRQYVLCKTELVYCTPQSQAPLDLNESGMLERVNMPRRVMLAPKGTTMRHEQDKLIEQLYDVSPKVVCQAELPLLSELTLFGGADVVLPRALLPHEAKVHCYPLNPRRMLYLVLAVNPMRTLPQPAHALEEIVYGMLADFSLKKAENRVEESSHLYGATVYVLRHNYEERSGRDGQPARAVYSAFRAAAFTKNTKRSRKASFFHVRFMYGG